MYTITKPAYVIHGPGKDEQRTVPQETRTFLTGAGLLRWALDNRLLEHRVGGVPYPTHFDDKYLGHPDVPHSDYGMIDTFRRWEFTPEHRAAMQRAALRYKEIIHYLREVEPEWRPDTSVSPTGMRSFADNSTELHEISKYGKRRHRMVEYPHGDACF
jgi:hypothetical protein